MGARQGLGAEWGRSPSVGAPWVVAVGTVSRAAWEGGLERCPASPPPWGAPFPHLV